MTLIDAMLDQVEWKALPWTPEDSELPTATHGGFLQLGECKLRVYQLNDGRRVIDAEDIYAFFCGAIMKNVANECHYCDSFEPCFDGRSMSGRPCQHPRPINRIDWLYRLQALIASAEECERLLKFAFEEGALPDETVAGLCVDPYGLLRDLRLSIAGVKNKSANPVDGG